MSTTLTLFVSVILTDEYHVIDARLKNFQRLVRPEVRENVGRLTGSYQLFLVLSNTFVGHSLELD